nr:MAG TPA: hypothetical protein [Caudoviricetes sp.]
MAFFHIVFWYDTVVAYTFFLKDADRICLLK